MKIKIDIKTIGGSILFSYEKEDNSIRDTLVEAVKQGVYLGGADLRGADLGGANLRGAYLVGANLRDANIEGANLEGAYLGGADFGDAYLRGANLRGAYLRGAKNIPQSYINLCSRDMLFVFEHLKSELPYLREKLVSGQIDGTQYEGECACLIGSLGKGNKKCIDKVVSKIPFYEKGLDNYGEQWFWQIRSGDTLENNFFAKHALELIDMVLNNKIGEK